MLLVKPESRGVLACKANVSYYVWRIDPQWTQEHIARQDTGSLLDL